MRIFLRKQEDAQDTLSHGICIPDRSDENSFIKVSSFSLPRKLRYDFINVRRAWNLREKKSQSLDIILSTCIDTLKLEQPTSFGGVGVNGKPIIRPGIADFLLYLQITRWLIMPYRRSRCRYTNSVEIEILFLLL